MAAGSILTLPLISHSLHDGQLLGRYSTGCRHSTAVQSPFNGEKARMRGGYAPTQPNLPPMPAPEKKKAGLASGLNGDEVKYAFTKALRRATRPTWGRCPSRAASKTSMPTLNGQRNLQIYSPSLSQTQSLLKRFKIFSKNIRLFFVAEPVLNYTLKSDVV